MTLDLHPKTEPSTEDTSVAAELPDKEGIFLQKYWSYSPSGEISSAADSDDGFCPISNCMVFQLNGTATSCCVHVEDIRQHVLKNVEGLSHV